MRKVFLSLFLLCLTPAWASEGKVLTLKECFQAAIVQSETLAMSEQSIRIAEAHYWQALGTVLPHIGVKGTEFIQDTGGDTSAAAGSVSSTFARRSKPELAVTASQPLFQGFREFRALKVSSAEKSKNNLSYQRAKQLLFADVAKAYYTVLELEREFEIQQSIRETLLKRLNDLKGRVSLGKSRQSELLSTESEIAVSDSDIESRRALIETSRDLLGFLTGREVTEKLIDEFQVPTEVPLAKSFMMELKQRPDLGASVEATKLAKGQLQYERGGYLPRLDLDANYYPYRVGFLSDIHWDVNFTLKVPLFEGGATYGKVKAAGAEFKQAELSQQLGDRQAELEVTQAHHSLIAIRRRENLLNIAASKSKQNYDSSLDEYRLGLVNNLEVLGALRSWQSRLMESNLVSFQTKLSYLDLLVAAGKLPLLKESPGETP